MRAHHLCLERAKKINNRGIIIGNMPLQSYFFPKEALQGEDLPSHITWSDLKFDCIKIVHPKAVTLKEVYNVSDKDISIKEEGLILINKVEVDGYLGIVFSSKPIII